MRSAVVATSLQAIPSSGSPRSVLWPDRRSWGRGSVSVTSGRDGSACLFLSRRGDAGQLAFVLGGKETAGQG